MIHTNDNIQLRNVISKKYTYYYKDLDKVMKSFLNEIDQLDVKVKGPFFYSMNNTPSEEIVVSDIYIGVDKYNVKVDENMTFYSYFEIQNMLSIVVKGDLQLEGDFEAQGEKVYGQLLHYINDNELEITTPFFYMTSKDDSLPYVIIMVGARTKR